MIAVRSVDDMAKKKLDDLAERMRGVDPARISGALRKEKRINVRVTATEHASVALAAERYGLGISEYLLRLHELAENRGRDDN